MFDFFVIFMMLFLIVMLATVFVAKRRMDRNEPIWGWKRKQFLAEQNGEASSPEAYQNRKTKQVKRINKTDTLKDLIGLKDIRYGVFEQSKNVYSLVISTDDVNFDLLNPSEQLSIITGYQSLFKVINFPLEILGQAVRQDFRKDEERFLSNLETANPQTRDYNLKVIAHIKQRTTEDFRITNRVYYIVSYVYETSKMGKLTAEQKERKIMESIYQQALIVRKMLSRAKVSSDVLGSLEGMEVLKRSLNRERMIINPIDGVVAEGLEKITSFITADPETLPGLNEFIQDFEEARELVI
ncbi:resistance to Congo red protein [Peribacillus loiseleuriae]|uniref:resistance to Congo red protein n=1 Tax=Peribacillus loiseleuriae TaxID=1679170 RepID=UPI003D06BF71